MDDEQIFRLVPLLALLLFLMPLVLRPGPEGRRRWHMAALGVFGLALLLALYRIAEWLAG